MEQIGLIAGIAIIVVLFLSGAPLFTVFAGGSIILYLFYAKLPITSLFQQGINSVSSFTFIAIPLFVLVGNIMGRTGAVGNLFDAIRVVTKGSRAGVGMTAVIACAIFGTMCGSSTATAVAVGTVAVPDMASRGYRKEEAAAICAVAGTMGILIPPSIPMIIQSEITRVPVGDIFLAGFIPGALCTILLCVGVWLSCRLRRGAAQPVAARKLDPVKTILKALPIAAIPLALFAVIYGGVSTPTEGAAVAAVVTFIVVYAMYGGISRQNLKAIFIDSVRSTAAIYAVIVGIVIFGRVLGYMRIPQNMALAVTNLDLSPGMILLVFLLLFFFMGTFLDAVALQFLVMAPLMPTMAGLGWDLIWFNIVFIMVTMVGAITPPVAVTLYATATTARADAMSVSRESLPYLAALVVATLVIAYVPAISTFLPNLLRK